MRSIAIRQIPPFIVYAIEEWTGPSDPRWEDWRRSRKTICVAPGGRDPPRKAFYAFRLSRIDHGAMKPRDTNSRFVNRGCDRQPVVALIIRDGCPGQRPDDAVHRVLIISELLQRALHVGHDLVGRKTVVSVNRLVVLIIRVVRIVAPCRIPPAGVPGPKAPVEENNGRAVISPPIAIVMMTTMLCMPAARFGKIVAFAVPIAQPRRSLRIQPAPPTQITMRPLARVCRAGCGAMSQVPAVLQRDRGATAQTCRSTQTGRSICAIECGPADVMNY